MSDDTIRLMQGDRVIGRWDASEALDAHLTQSLAWLRGGRDQPKGSSMKEAMAELRELRDRRKRALRAQIDKVRQKTIDTYDRADRKTEDHERELEEMVRELELMDDDDNQELGGNRPPPGSGNSG